MTANPPRVNPPRSPIRSDAIDRDALHRYLWRKTNNRNRILVNVGALAEEIGIGEDHMGRIINQMRDKGRLKKVGRESKGILLVIYDPDAATYP